MSLYITEPLLHKTTVKIMGDVCKNNVPRVVARNPRRPSAPQGRDLSKIRLLIAVKTAAKYEDRRKVNRETWVKIAVKLYMTFLYQARLLIGRLKKCFLVIFLMFSEQIPRRRSP